LLAGEARDFAANCEQRHGRKRETYDEREDACPYRAGSKCARRGHGF
jgi:hypothetical protein